MITDLSEEARELGRQAHRALEAAGGDSLVHRAEAAPGDRHGLVVPVLDQLGAWDLDVRGSADELEAAAALCRAAGWWSVAYPVAERLARPAGSDGLLVVAGRSPSAAVDGLDLRWSAVAVDGQRFSAAPRGATEPPRMGAFVSELELTPVDDDGTADVPLALVLPCWTLLGMLDRAMALTRAYVQEREQFGQPLAKFQGVQFQLTDAEVERAGVEELAKYALWSVQVGGDDALADVLALRLAAVEAAEVVFRVCHQLHGAIGFCDETQLSWISRYSQPLRRLPLGPSATLDELTRVLGRRSLAGIFR